VERVYIRRLNSVGVQYLVQLKLPKALDDKVMRKLAEAKSLYPKVSKNGIILGVIERGLKYLSKKTLVPHSKEKGKPYVPFTVAFSDISNIEELVEKLDSNKTEICYNALIRGIEHG